MIDNKRRKESPEELSLDHGWCIGEKNFGILLEELKSFPIEDLVEFGSGVSSVRLALELPQIRIHSIENSLEYHEKTVQLLNRYVPGHRVTVELRELRWQNHGLGLYQSYSKGQFPPRIDAIIIDGPPGWTSRGREACLYQAFDSLRVGGRVYLDDYDRMGEQQIVRNWRAMYPGVFNIRVPDISPARLCILEKTKGIPHTRLSLRVALDNWTFHVTRKARALRDLACRRRE